MKARTIGRKLPPPAPEPVALPPRPPHECNTWVEDFYFTQHAELHHIEQRRYYCIHGRDKILGPIPAPIPEPVYHGANGQVGMAKGNYKPRATPGAPTTARETAPGRA